MKRTTVLTSLGSISLSVILAFSAWVGLAFMRSKPVSTDRVLGASSSEVSVTPTPLPYPVRSEAKAPTIQARRYALYNPDSGKLLEGKDANLQVPIASTTKLMTTYVIARMGQTSDEIVVSREAAFQIGSLMNLRPGEKITIDSLLKGALLVSGNDAAMALAEYGGGRLLANPSAPREERVARFVEEMNATANKLGMANTKYADPAGLDDTGHSTALDLAKLAHHTTQDSVIKAIISTPSVTVTNVSGTIRHDLRNSNRLVADYFYEGVIGGKTGFTPEAGHCLLSAAERNGMKLIAVVLSTYAETKEASAQETRKLLDWGFANWHIE